MSRDHDIAHRLIEWFRTNCRDLPWRRTRRGRRDPYASLVSEFMLQQTQVSRVLDHFEPFMSRFPTVQDLAHASEEHVRQMWSGLGYYSRARRLHQAAQAILKRHNGRVPQDLTPLLDLPGVGRYTAGAIASIVFKHPAPIVDGNVSRVLQRLDGIARPQRDDWPRAAELVASAADPAAFNEGLMELGALICTPRNPSCDACPLASLCNARKNRTVDTIPAPRVRPERQHLYAASLVATDRAGRVLLEQRPPSGLFASLWQSPTLERPDRSPTPDELASHAGCRSLIEVGTIDHATTHRQISTIVYTAASLSRRAGRTWIDLKLKPRPAMSNLQRRIIALGLDHLNLV